MSRVAAYSCRPGNADGVHLLRNYLTAALRNLARNWLYAGITVLGLAAGFAAAILIGLYVRDEYSFERFISGYRADLPARNGRARPGPGARARRYRRQHRGRASRARLPGPRGRRAARALQPLGGSGQGRDVGARGVDRPRLLQGAALSGARGRPGRGLARPQRLGAHPRSGAQVLRRGRADRRDATGTGPGGR